MPDIQQTPQPAILFSHFDGSAGFVAMAKELQSAGYPVIASVQEGDREVRLQAEAIGCDVAEHEPDGGFRAGLVLFRDKWIEQLPGVVVFEPEDGFGVGDALQVAEAFQANSCKFVLASRRRNLKLGLFTNMVRWLAALAFTLVHGRKVGDPWASLRAIPSQFVPGFLTLKGDSCKFHLNMLLNLQHMGIKTVSVPVSTAYDYECESRLWDRFVDIFRIVLLPLKFVSASLMTFLVDYAVTILVGYVLTQNKRMLTIILGRLAGAIVGYILNKNIVFRSKGTGLRNEWVPVLQYTLLAAVNCTIALVLIPMLQDVFGGVFMIAKVMVDIILFAASFTIQKSIIFRKKQKV